MTEEGRDPKVSARYAELAREAPPRELDEAILAAARREAGARPAPLVAPAGRRRWYFPLAAAAVIVLAVSVTLQVERERPDVAAPQAMRDEPHPASPAAPAQDKAVVAEPDRARQAAREPERPLVARPGAAQRGAVVGVEPSKPAIESRRFTPDPGPAVAAKPAPAPAGAPAAPPPVAEPSRASAGVAGRIAEEAADTPERQLERIAELRRQGRHEEADRALAEFRRRHPEYRIPEAMLQKVLPPR